MNDNNELHSGIDIIEIDRIQNVLTKHPERFLRKIFTEYEINYCRGRATQLAARFASKEAAMKALGTGIRGVGWREVEVQRLRSGKPYIILHGRAKKRAESMGIKKIELSISHSKNLATAMVIMYK
jgi:holo-[acyl-carrier protein] synthase